MQYKPDVKTAHLCKKAGSMGLGRTAGAGGWAAGGRVQSCGQRGRGRAAGGQAAGQGGTEGKGRAEVDKAMQEAECLQVCQDLGWLQAGHSESTHKGSMHMQGQGQRWRRGEWPHLPLVIQPSVPG